MWLWVVVCLYMIDLWWTCDLSSVYPAFASRCWNRLQPHLPPLRDTWQNMDGWILFNSMLLLIWRGSEKWLKGTVHQPLWMQWNSLARIASRSNRLTTGNERQCSGTLKLTYYATFLIANISDYNYNINSCYPIWNKPATEHLLSKSVPHYNQHVNL